MANTKVSSEQIIDGLALGGNPTAATQTAGNNSTRLATTAYTDAAVTALIGGAPSTLDTLNEIAAAVSDDPDYVGTVNAALALKAPKASPTFTGTVTTAAISGTTGQFGTSLNVDGTATVDGLTVDGNPVINGTSPQLFLQTGAANTNWQIAAQENVANAFEISSGANDASAPNDTYTKRLVVQNNGDISFYNSSGSAAKLFYDASAESLSISGNVISASLSSTSTGRYHYIQNAAGNQTYPVYSFQGDSNTGIMSDTADTLSLVTGGDTRVKIDSSGNVLVGQQTASSNTVGTSLRQDGRNFFCADGNYSAHFNRKSSDGAVVHFAKNDEIVGSWMSRGGAVSTIILNPVGAGTGLTASGTQLLPTTGAGALNNGANDLGANGYAFRDLYLSGGVVFGPASASNVSSQTLDSYEEGDFTLVLSGATTAGTNSGGSIGGRYTKIGRLVTCNIVIANTTLSGAAGTLTFTGFPFVPANYANRPPVGVIRTYQQDLAAPSDGYFSPVIAIDHNANSAVLVQTKDNGTWSVVQVENSSGLYFEGTITYPTA